MDYFYILILFILLFSKGGLSSQDMIMTSSNNMPVKLGYPVTISCKLSDEKKKDNPFIFKHGEIMLSENCKAFVLKKYTINCINNKEFHLTIKNMSWDERGDWFCLYTSIVKNISLEIYVAPDIDMVIQTIPKRIFSKNLGSAALPLKHLSYPLVNGRGSESNPFDLRNELTVNLICKSGCGYPVMSHAFNFKNSSNFSLQVNDKLFSSESKECNANPKRKMFSVISTLEFNCSLWKLYGLLNLSCSAVHPSYKTLLFPMVIAEDHVFILCPTDPIEWWKMTYGERINTGIGCFFGMMLILYLFLLVCRWKSNKYNDIDDPCQGVLTPGNNDSATYKTRGYRV